MEAAETIPHYKIHHGRNVKRFRELFGIKQEVLAEEIGLSQQSISRLESQEELDEATLTKIAKALKVPVDALKNFNEDAAINIISNTFQDDASLNNYTNHYKCNFNPIDKVVELYEKLLQAEKEKVAMLQEVLKGRE